jgi:hypothetical protein
LVWNTEKFLSRFTEFIIQGQYERPENRVETYKVIRVNYASPLEIVLTSFPAFAAGGTAVLFALPRVIREFSRLRVHFAQDKLEKAQFDAELEAMDRALAEEKASSTQPVGPFGGILGGFQPGFTGGEIDAVSQIEYVVTMLPDGRVRGGGVSEDHNFDNVPPRDQEPS